MDEEKAKSLEEEFDLKTATFVFTSRSSRIRIVTAKIVSTALADMPIGLCGGILYDVVILSNCRKITDTTSLRKSPEI